MKFRSAVFACMFLFCIQSFAQHTYLVNRHAPEDSHKCDIYKYNGPSSEKIEMAGGEVGYGGFNFWDEGAFVTFRLGGQYEKLSFLMGQCKEIIRHDRSLQLPGEHSAEDS